MALRRVLFLSAALCLLFNVESKCYFPDGSEVLHHVACRSGDGFSACCEQGFACLSNGLCNVTEHVPDLEHRGLAQHNRESCTDPTWESTDCPLFCLNSDLDPLNHGAAVHKCEMDVDRYWCINKKTLGMKESDRCLDREVYFQFAGKFSL